MKKQKSSSTLYKCKFKKKPPYMCTYYEKIIHEEFLLKQIIGELLGVSAAHR